jgi:hypothetical protein
MRHLHKLSATKLEWNFYEVATALRLCETQFLDEDLQTWFSLKYDFDEASRSVVSVMMRPGREPLQPHAPTPPPLGPHPGDQQAACRLDSDSEPESQSESQADSESV